MATYYGERIIAARKARGMTQADLANKMGLPRNQRNMLTRWEKNQVAPRRKGMRKVAAALGMDVYSLFPEEFPRGDFPMTMNEYQQAAQRTMNLALGFEETSSHALHGMCAEVGEIHSLFQKFYQGHEIDAEHVMKEVGDLLWMIAEFCTVHSWSLSDVAQKNIDKLMARYPEGFNVEQSLNRKEGDV
jgi:transcriptional regulator with XRE-family HTH domain